MVVDIFGGSNATGHVADSLERRWLSFDLESQYVAASALRFLPKGVDDELAIKIYQEILDGSVSDLRVVNGSQVKFKFSA